MQVYLDLAPTTRLAARTRSRYDDIWSALKAVPSGAWVAVDAADVTGKDGPSKTAVLCASAKRLNLRIQTVLEGDKLFIRERLKAGSRDTTSLEPVDKKVTPVRKPRTPYPTPPPVYTGPWPPLKKPTVNLWDLDPVPEAETTAETVDAKLQ